MNKDTIDAGQTSLELDDTDIPGAHLDEVLKAHNVTALHWCMATVLWYKNQCARQETQ